MVILHKWSSTLQCKWKIYYMLRVSPVGKKMLRGSCIVVLSVFWQKIWNEAQPQRKAAHVWHSHVPLLQRQAKVSSIPLSLHSATSRAFESFPMLFNLIFIYFFLPPSSTELKVSRVLQTSGVRVGVWAVSQHLLCSNSLKIVKLGVAARELTAK